MKNKIILLISSLFLLTLVGCKNSDTNEMREISSTFSVPVTFSDGTKGEFLFIGEEGKVGLLVGSVVILK